MKTHKAVIGEDYAFRWRSPRPLASSPTLTVTPPASGATFGGAMSAVSGPAAISSIASDRRTLTLSAAIEAPLTPPNGLVGTAYGPVAIIGQRGGFALAQVSHFTDSTTAVLSEPLPHTVDVSDILADSGGVASLQWLTYAYTLDSADIGADPKRNFSWVVQFTSRQGGSAPSVIETSRGLLHAVRAPFNTGLDHAGLVGALPQLTVYGQQDSLAPQIRSALDHLEAMLFQQLPAGSYPDDVDGAQFLPAHVMLAQWLITTGRSVAQNEPPDMTLYDRAAAWVGEQMGRLAWLDADGDGRVDSGEEDSNEGANPVSGGTFDAAFAAARTYYSITQDR